MDLTRPAGHMFDAVNKTLRLLKSSYNGGFARESGLLGNIKIFLKFFIFTESCGIGNIDVNGRSFGKETTLKSLSESACSWDRSEVFSYISKCI